ncbi:MAG: nickel pincer cofactor biosynthesis protein LarB [Thermodesulfovibrionales bacterium]|nr:nickel pincer cofactor biosynthesis protein LarB [Thermodesulfovibrionales bacterium]
MDSEKTLRDMLEAVQKGGLGVEKALQRLRHLPYEDIGTAKIDHHRALRQGIPEVVLASGKKTGEVIAIARAIYKRQKKLFITRATKEIYDKLGLRAARFHPLSGIISAGGEKTKKGSVLVISAGTSDIAVAEEAAETASFLGNSVKTVYDAGVAGIHRLMDNRNLIDSSNVLIVVAGMEGALPSVVGGITDKPVIAVPTSVGYGTSLGGLAALFAMLNSCVPGIAVMNIDNGFGAGCLAHKINKASLRLSEGS